MNKLTVIMLLIVLGAGLVFLPSCGRKEDGALGDNSDAPHMEDQQESKEIEQNVCPVMGNPVNRDIFVEYKGRKIYFCCQACVPTFKENPEKYFKNLDKNRKKSSEDKKATMIEKVEKIEMLYCSF